MNWDKHGWLRHYATSRKDASSNPDKILFFLIYLMFSAALWPQPQSEISTRNLPECKGLPAPETDNLTAICEPIVHKS
jgi:hypothetical protein